MSLELLGLLLELLLKLLLLLLYAFYHLLVRGPPESYRMIPDWGSDASGALRAFACSCRAFALFWRSQSVFLRPSSVLCSNLARPTSILLAQTLPGTLWTSFLQAETG